MKCFESPSGMKNPIIWHKRQSVRDFVKQKPMFSQLMRESKNCMLNHPELKNNVKGAIQCETLTTIRSILIRITYHTLAKLTRTPQEN